jgi:hypothetical protein
MFEEELNNLLKNIKKNSPQRKEQIHLEGQSLLKKTCQKYLKKKECVTERVFKQTCSINCQKQITYLVCGEYVAQMFESLSLSKIKLPFQKEVFTRHIDKVSGKDK